MQKQSFMRADEVAQELGISKSHAYKVIHGLNEELQEKGYLTISGRVNRQSILPVTSSPAFSCIFLTAFTPDV